MPPTVGGRRLCIVMMTLRRPQYACYGSRGTRVWRPWYAYYGDRRTTGKRPEWGQKYTMGIFLKASASLQFYHLYRTEACYGLLSASPLSARDFCINIHPHPCQTGPFPIKQKLPKALCGFREQAYAGSKKASVMPSPSDMVLFFFHYSIIFFVLWYYTPFVMVLFSLHQGIILPMQPWGSEALRHSS